MVYNRWKHNGITVYFCIFLPRWVQWYLCTRENPYMLSTLSQKLSQCCLWNSFRSVLIGKALFSSSQGRSTNGSFFFYSVATSTWSMVWCPWLCVVSGVSDSSTFQMFREASHLRLLLCPSFCVLGHLPWFPHVRNSSATAVFQGGCRTLSHTILGLLFHSCGKLAESM